MRILSVLLVILGIAVIGAGIYTTLSKSETSSKDIVTIQEEPALAESEAAKIVVATAGGITITQQDVLDAYENLPENMRQNDLETVYPSLLEQLINTRLLDTAAREAIPMNDEELQQGLRDSRDQLMRNLYLNRLVADAVTEDKLRDAYEELIVNVPDVQQRRARHILVKEEQEAKDIITQLNEGKDFVELAKENSIGPSAQNGGDLGYFAEDEMVPSFSQAAFALELGQHSSEPVQTQFGWHVIKVEDARVQPKPSFEQAKQAIDNKIRTEIVEKNFNDMRENANIVRYNLDGSTPAEIENTPADAPTAQEQETPAE